MQSVIHPFDAATRLTGENGHYHGHTSEHYVNMIGPFGGLIAAIMLKAVMVHPERKGQPLSLTVNYAAPIADGAFEIKANLVRNNRSTQHWRLDLEQNGEIMSTGTAVFATRRETWTATDAVFPSAPPASTVAQFAPKGTPTWLKNYDVRIIRGSALDDTEDSLTLVWMRDEPKRPLDFLSLTAYCDVFLPRIYVKRKRVCPIGTVSFTVYYHCDENMLSAHGDGEVLGAARGLRFYNGFFDQWGEIWTPKGELLATTSQVVYFKE